MYVLVFYEQRNQRSQFDIPKMNKKFRQNISSEKSDENFWKWQKFCPTLFCPIRYYNSIKRGPEPRDTYNLGLNIIQQKKFHGEFSKISPRFPRFDLKMCTRKREDKGDHLLNPRNELVSKWLHVTYAAWAFDIIILYFQLAERLREAWNY